MTADQLSSIIGEPAAISLINAKAGKRVYVAKEPGGILSDLIGNEAEARMIAAYGGGYVNIPIAKSWRFDRIMKAA